MIKAARLAPSILLLATVLAGPAFTQTAATPPRAKAAQPAAPAKALVSNSSIPTFDEGTVQRIAAAMLSYSAIEVRGGWPTLPANAKLAPGSRGPEVALLRERLAITDDLPADKAAGDLYDDAVAAGVRHFQARHGLEETGSVGPKTLAALNVPVGKRLRQLAASLDRLAAMDFTFGQRYVVVNIPAAFAEAVEGDKVVRRYVVVVGKPDRPSPTLTTHITAVNLNPTWTVPLSIMKKDIITKMRKDPGYVDRMHMRVLDGAGGEIDPQAGRLELRPRAELHHAAGFRRLERARRGAHRHAESVFGLHARHQPQGIVQRRLPLPVLGLHARREPARSRRLAAGGQSGLEPPRDRRRHRQGPAHRRAARPQGAGRLGLSHRLGDARRLRSTSATTSTITTRSRRWSRDARPQVASAARASGFVLQSADTRPGPVSQVSYLDSQ